MKLRRDVAALPVRSGEETWTAIIDLLTAADSTEPDQLVRAESIMAALLSEEYYAEHPLTVVGESHRVVIYMSYGSDAITADIDLAPLGWNPTAGDWQMFIPCAPEHLDWATRMLAEMPRLVLLSLDDEIPERKKERSGLAPLQIDWRKA